MLGGAILLAGSWVVVAAQESVPRWEARLFSAVNDMSNFWWVLTVKDLVSRGRPTAFFTEVRLHDQATGFGYVSGHAAVAFALAAVLAPSLPRAWRAVVIALAVTVAFGRVYAGVHLPLDVVGGAGLGLLCGTLARWAFGLGGEGLPVAPVGDEPPP